MTTKSDGGEKLLDAGELTRVLGEVAARSARLFSAAAAKPAASAGPTDDLGIAKAYMDLYARTLSDPQKAMQAAGALWADYGRLWQSSWLQLFGLKPPAVVEPAKGDNRFKDADWSSQFVFDLIKQSYLVTARHVQSAVTDVDGLPEASQRKVAFFTRQFIDALSPSNFVATNPQVLREVQASGGQNLLQGLSNLLGDLERGDGELRVSMTDEKSFEMGRNVATTPGSVVYENKLMQLIQYRPATAEVHRAPLVIIPPWINKYYILDLRPANSFIKWATEQGHTVFVISWVNPDETLAETTFDDYLRLGPQAALDAIEKATGERQVNFIGYCLGGTLLATFLAVLAARGGKGGLDRVLSATYFVSLLDFSEPGELGAFVDRESVERIEARIAGRGYLEGAEMATTFNMLRANDLIWSFVVNNYLLGKEPMPFDLLYWNSDSTRMPAKMHSFYLRNMYVENRLAVPGGISLDGTPVDLSKAMVPACFISTVEDHIAPWKTCYKGSRYVGGEVRFLLGGSGHIAGIVNPPSAKKYHYWTNDKAVRDADAETWFAGATQHPGSWWTDWQQWIEGRMKQAGAGMVPAREPGKGKLKIVEPAPGRYAMLRLGTKAE